MMCVFLCAVYIRPRETFQRKYRKYSYIFGAIFIYGYQELQSIMLRNLMEEPQKVFIKIIPKLQKKKKHLLYCNLGPFQLLLNFSWNGYKYS